VYRGCKLKKENETEGQQTRMPYSTQIAQPMYSSLTKQQSLAVFLKQVALQPNSISITLQTDLPEPYQEKGGSIETTSMLAKTMPAYPSPRILSPSVITAILTCKKPAAQVAQEVYIGSYCCCYQQATDH